MSNILIIAEPILVPQGREVSTDPVRIPLRQVFGEDRVSVQSQEKVVGNGSVLIGDVWNIKFNSKF